MTPSPTNLALLAITVLILSCSGAGAQQDPRAGARQGSRAGAQQGPTPAEAAATFDQLEKELTQLYAQMIARYDRATPKERQDLPDVNLWPREQMMPKIAEAAGRFAGMPAAVPFHLWILRDSRRLTDRSLAVASIDRLLADHIEDERLEDLANWLPRYTRGLGVQGALTRLERLRKRNGKRDVQAACMLAQVSVLQASELQASGVQASGVPASGVPASGVEGNQEDLKSRLREVMAFAPNSASGKRAKARLFEIEHLQIGCTAPDIAGIDLDGVAFQLSDYKGKVIFLDFWGDW